MYTHIYLYIITTIQYELLIYHYYFVYHYHHRSPSSAHQTHSHRALSSQAGLEDGDNLYVKLDELKLARERTTGPDVLDADLRAYSVWDVQKARQRDREGSEMTRSFNFSRA